MTPQWTLDSFAIISLSQIVSMFSGVWGNVTLLLIPAYLVYKFGGVLVGYCCRAKSEKTEDQPL